MGRKNQNDSLIYCESHNSNCSMFKTKTHNAYIKKKSYNDSIKNRNDS